MTNPAFHVNFTEPDREICYACNGSGESVNENFSCLICGGSGDLFADVKEEEMDDSDFPGEEDDLNREQTERQTKLIREKH